MVVRVGILAVQGNMQRHGEALASLGVASCAVKTIEALRDCSHLVIPGGESSVLLHNLDESFRAALKDFAQTRPVLGTCAGLILMARKVIEPEQESLGLLDVCVQRNGFGRQLSSFVTTDVTYLDGEKSIEGVFIRAPRIVEITSEAVEVLGRYQDEAVLVRQGRCYGATFHPELSKEVHPVLETFIAESLESPCSSNIANGA